MKTWWNLSAMAASGVYGGEAFAAGLHLRNITFLAWCSGLRSQRCDMEASLMLR